MRLGWQVVVGLSCFFLLVVGRVAWEGHTAWRAGVTALEQGDAPEALLHFDRAIQWYLPLAPWWHDSLQQLQGMGQRAETPEQALRIYETLRSGLLATRSFYTPEAQLLSTVNDQIATLQVSLPGARWPDPTLTPEARYAQARALLEKSYAPEPGWSVLASLGFLGWVGSALGFFSRGFAPEGRFLPQEGLRWGMGVVAGYVAWVVGLLRA